MVTEGPGGEDSMVYDITLSEIQGAMEHWSDQQYIRSTVDSTWT